MKGILLLNTWASQQHNHLKHGGREPVASKKVTVGQAVLNFSGQVMSSKILRFSDENCEYLQNELEAQ